MMPIVTIVIPTYNRAHVIEEALLSIQGQTYTNWECIIVDDGSTDNTLEVLKGFEKKDNRFKIHTRPKNRTKGANACRNIGIEKSQGAYLIFLDSDDTLAKKCLENRIQCFDKNKNIQGLIFSTGILSDDGKTVTPFSKKIEKDIDSQAYAKMLLSYDIPWQITNPIWKREVFDNYGGFDEHMLRFQDVDLHTKLMLCGVNVKKLDDIDFYYKLEDGFEKYQDDVFISKACNAILYYIKKYLQPSHDYTLDTQERKKYLAIMFLKTIHKFIYAKKRQALFKTFLKFEKQHKLLSGKTRRLLRLLYIIDTYQLLEKKGLGFYKLEKYARNQVFNFK